MKFALPSYPLRAVHLIAIWAYAVSQPVFSLLHGNPEFLAVRGSTRSEVVAFAVLLTFAPPLVAVICEWLVSLVSRIGADILHLLFLGLFAMPLAMLVLRRFDPNATAAVIGASTISFAIVMAYARWRLVRSFFTLAVSLSIVGLVLFVVAAPVAKDDVAGAQVRVSNRTPVVMVVLDELPVTSLMTRSGRIDTGRYPNFGRLARDATWYSRTTAAHESSTAAVPSILTGQVPQQDELPTLTHHPENLFTLLGESYHMNVHESVTYLCPRRYCPRRRDTIVRRLGGLFSDVQVGFLHRVLPRSLARGLPQISDRWGGFSKEQVLVARDSRDIFRMVAKRTLSQPEQFDDFLAGLSADEPTATLHLVHLLLPHSPWRYLPSGRIYGQAPRADGLDSDLFWSDDPWLVQQAFQRHLLQVGYTDALLGQLLDQLERTGLYDRALIVVVADHGVSFLPGGNSRHVSPENIADIARVPLLIKVPRQRGGRVDPRAARTIDVLPTIVDVLDVRLPWTVDGRSLLETRVEPRSISVGRSDGTDVQASPSEVERGVAATLKRKIVHFGEGGDSLYKIGLHRQLLGREIRTATVSTIGARAVIDGDAMFANVRTSSRFIPTRITGRIDGTEIRPNPELAVAVNGRIVALTRCFLVGGTQRFSAQVPETAFREGSNRVEVLLIEGSRAVPRLVRLGHGPATE